MALICGSGARGIWWKWSSNVGAPEVLRRAVGVQPVSYEKDVLGDDFVGAPCSRGAFYAPSYLSYLESPLPHGNRLVKFIRLGRPGEGYVLNMME